MLCRVQTGLLTTKLRSVFDRRVHLTHSNNPQRKFQVLVNVISYIQIIHSCNSQGMQQQLLEAKAAQGDLPAFLLDNKKDKEKDVTMVAEWPPKAKRSMSKEPEVSTCAPPPRSSANGNLETKTAEVQTELASSRSTETNSLSTDQGIPGKDARSVAILSTFLSVLSYGISTNAIASHLVNMQEGIDKHNVEKLLSRCVRPALKNRLAVMYLTLFIIISDTLSVL